MDFPIGYAEQILPKMLHRSLSFLIFLVTFIQAFLRLLRLSRLFRPQISWPEHWPDSRPVSASIIQEMLPAMKFSDACRLELGLGLGLDKESEQCAVCLYEFRDYDEVRVLKNCSHIFHRGCVDRWMDHDQITCPLCRTLFVPYDLMEVFHEKIAEASVMSAVPEFGGEFSIINNFL